MNILLKDFSQIINHANALTPCAKAGDCFVFRLSKVRFEGDLGSDTCCTSAKDVLVNFNGIDWVIEIKGGE